MQAVQSLKQKGAVLDTVDALDDEDPEPVPLTPEEAAEAVADWHQTGYVEG